MHRDASTSGCITRAASDSSAPKDISTGNPISDRPTLDYSRYAETKHKTRFGLHPCGNVHRRLVNRNVWPKRSRSDPSPVVQTDNYHQTQMFAGKSERVHTRPFGHDYRLRVNRAAPPVCATVTICIDGAAIPSQIVLVSLPSTRTKDQLFKERSEQRAEIADWTRIEIESRELR